jgi:hypothetical protein
LKSSIKKLKNCELKDQNQLRVHGSFVGSLEKNWGTYGLKIFAGTPVRTQDVGQG